MRRQRRKCFDAHQRGGETFRNNFCMGTSLQRTKLLSHTSALSQIRARAKEREKESESAGSPVICFNGFLEF